MAKQQTKRRRKRYAPGSAYAGDVRPTGILGFLSSTRLMQIVFVLMALALVGGGFAGFLRSGLLGGGSKNPADFVLPPTVEEDGATPQPDATVEVRQYAGPPAMSIDPEKRYVATIKTELGDIQVELFASQAPQTVNNFVFLAQHGFYDGLVFHYVKEGFTANAGDPACTAAQTDESVCRGNGGPGYELTEDAPGSFQKGTLGMANASQFFITLSDSEQFEQFTPFGQITSGLEVAEQVAAGTEIQTIEIQEQ